MSRRNRYIVVQAKPHRTVALSVMAGRTYKCHHRAMLFERIADPRYCSSCRETSDYFRVRRCVCICIELNPSSTHRGNFFEIRRFVHASQGNRVNWRRFNNTTTARPPAFGDTGHDCCTCRLFWMTCRCFVVTKTGRADQNYIRFRHSLNSCTFDGVFSSKQLTGSFLKLVQ